MTNLLPKHKPERANLPLRERITELQDWLREEAEIKIRAANYQLESELYDLTLPGYYNKYNEWIPASEYLSDSVRHANFSRRHWSKGVNKKKFQIYNEEYSTFSVEELKQEIEGLNNILRPK